MGAPEDSATPGGPERAALDTTGAESRHSGVLDDPSLIAEVMPGTPVRMRGSEVGSAGDAAGNGTGAGAAADGVEGATDGAAGTMAGHEGRRLLWQIVVLIAVAELALMVLISLLPLELNPFWEGIVDAVALALVSGGILWWRSIRPLYQRMEAEFARAEDANTALQREISAQQFNEQLHRALEMAEGEDEVFEVIVRTVEVASGAESCRAELLLADSSYAHLHQVLVVGQDPPHCEADSPHRCVAVRQGQPLVFDSSTAIDACPKLRGRQGGPLSAVCVPMSILGRSVGVLHVVGADHRPPEHEVARYNRIVSAAGSRLGLLRALADSQLQASTDVLTGLANRRTFENRLHQMKHSGRGWAVAIADLDHFKQLNDAHGHEVGDRALRLFSRVLSDTVRSGDLAARYGGEEFACLFPDGTEEVAMLAAERIRRRLQELLMHSDVPPFCVSIGVAAAVAGGDPAEVIRDADRALYEAKRNGRDCVMTSTDSAAQ